MIIGIVGNRTGFTYPFVKRKLEELHVYKSDVIVSGGADGVDSHAAKFAKEIGCKLITFYPDPTKPSPERYFHRNEMIVLESNILVAFNAKGRSGTLNTINHAKRLKKPFIEINKDGIIQTILGFDEAIGIDKTVGVDSK